MRAFDVRNVLLAWRPKEDRKSVFLRLIEEINSGAGGPFPSRGPALNKIQL